MPALEFLSIKKTNIKSSIPLKISSVLWAIWGVFHIFIGIALLNVLAKGYPVGDFMDIPRVVSFTMLQQQNVFAVIATLKQLAFNLAWAGVVVSIGCIFIWKGSKTAIFLCAIVGGLCDLGYFIYIDLAGYGIAPGPQMTYICAIAIILSFYAYFKNN